MGLELRVSRVVAANTRETNMRCVTIKYNPVLNLTEPKSNHISAPNLIESVDVLGVNSPQQTPVRAHPHEEVRHGWPPLSLICAQDEGSSQLQVWELVVLK